MDQRNGELFDGQGSMAMTAATTAAPRVSTARPEAIRVVMPNRTQVELRPMDLESLLPEGHRARLVWSLVSGLDLKLFYASLKVREGGAGRSAIAPEILLTLWLYATLEGVGSARQLSRLVLEHDAYRWISGGLQVNYHTLADFRVGHGAALDDLLSTNVAALMATKVVKLERAAQDGMRVRASAGAASFRRRGSLEEHLAQARTRVQELKAQLASDLGQDHRRAHAAKERARREREERVAAALARMPELEAIKRQQSKKGEDARASSTDADATVMKMGDGGFRPAYNTQFATDCESQVIVGVAVSTAGSDMAQLAPMVAQVEQRLGTVPPEWLIDGGFPAHAQLDAVATKTTVYAPVPESPVKKDDASGERPDKFTPKPTDSSAVAAWRQRMATPEAQELYKQRAATAECVNAQARNRGLQRFLVRGLPKVTCVALLFALAHNFMRTVVLAPDLVGIGTNPSAAAAG